jgi:O-antigen ligase
MQAFMRGSLDAMATRTALSPKAARPGFRSGEPANTKPWSGVQWSPLFVVFLLYVFIITSNRIPVGTETMVVALIALVFQRDSFRLGPVGLWAIAGLGWSAAGILTAQYTGVVKDAVNEDLKVCLVTLTMINAIRTRRQLSFFLFFFIGCFALFPIRGAVFNYFIYHGTTYGRAAWNFIFSNPNDLAGFLVLQLSIAYGIAAAEPKGWVKKAGVLGGLVIPFVILLTQSRGGFLAMIAFYAIVVEFKTLRIRRIVFGLAGAVIVAVTAPDAVWDRVAGLKNVTNTEQLSEVDPEGSAEQRWEIWKVGSAIWSDNKISGVGRGAYKMAHSVYALQSKFKPTAQGFRDTHSLYLNVLAETGVIGLILFLGMVGHALMFSRRVRKSLPPELKHEATLLKALEAGLLAYMVAGLWGSLAHLVFTFAHVALVWIAAHIVAEAQTRARVRVAPRARISPA